MFDLVILPPWGWLFAGLWGALWGSFFNVAIYRVGLYDSVVFPPSRCTSCGGAIAFYDNIPIVSWLLLGGRCRRCRARISARYPLVEAASSLLALALYWRFLDVGDGLAVAAHFFVYFGFTGTLLVLSAIDLDHLRLPSSITHPAVPLFFVCGLLLRDVAPLDLFLGAIVGYGSIAVVAEVGELILKRTAMGMGDAMLMMVIGALLGWRAVVWTFFLAPYPALLITVPLKIIQRRQIFKVEIPYGPFLAMAAVGYVFFGQRMMALLP